VDYLFQVRSFIVPAEVKAGTTGALKSSALIYDLRGRTNLRINSCLKLTDMTEIENYDREFMPLKGLHSINIIMQDLQLLPGSLL